MTGPAGHPIALFGAHRLADLRRRAVESNSSDPPTVFIVEGEWDRMMMEQNDLKAVCSTGGANGWKDGKVKDDGSKEPDWAEKFDGLDVVVLYDNDKTGAQGAARVRQNLQRRGRTWRLRVATWPFGADEKLPNGSKPKDACDWFQLKHTTDEVWQFLAETPELDRGTPSNEENGANGANGTFRVIQGGLTEGGGDGAGTISKPIIRIVPELWHMADQAREVLIGVKEKLYNRSGVLVTIHERTRKSLPPFMRAEDYALGGAFLDQISAIELVGLMSKHINFVQEKKGEWEPVQPPENLAKLLVARGGGEWPPVVRISSAPILRNDGSIYATPGYDEASGCLYVPPVGVVYDDIPESPTRDDALAAWEVLRETFANFPFVKVKADGSIQEIKLGNDSVTISAILTVHAASFCPRRPIHHCQAPAKGSGKTYWVLAVAICATGRIYPVWIPSGESDEERKQLFSIALSGDDLLIADNLDGQFGSPRLASFITSGAIQDRLMGSNQMKSVYANVAMLTNGSNTQFRDTLERRVIPTFMDARMEDPEDRDRSAFTYKGTPVEYALKHRHRIVPAGLTILKAYLAYLAAGGKPPTRTGEGIGGFENWEDLVRDAILWLGKDDPLINRSKQRERHDADREHRHILLESFYASYQCEKVKPAQIVKLEESPDHQLNEAERQLIEAVRGRDRKLKAKSVGSVLSKYQDVVVTIDSKAKVALRKTYSAGYPTYYIEVVEEAQKASSDNEQVVTSVTSSMIRDAAASEARDHADDSLDGEL